MAASGDVKGGLVVAMVTAAYLAVRPSSEKKRTRVKSRFLHDSKKPISVPSIES
jgi:hypothetical protein